MFEDLISKVKKQFHILLFAEALVLLAAVGALFQKFAALNPRRPFLFLFFFILALVFYLALSFLWQQVTKRISIAYGRIVRLSFFVFLPIITAIFLAERLGGHVYLGILFMIGGLYLLQSPSAREKEREEKRETEGARLFHFLGDACSFCVYRDLPSRSRDSFFFRFVNEKRRELEIRREERALSKKAEKERAAAKAALEAAEKTKAEVAAKAENVKETVKEAAEKGKEEVKTASEKLGDDVEKVKTEVGKVADEVKSAAGEAFRTVKEKAAEVKEKLKTKADEGKARVESAAENVAEAVPEKTEIKVKVSTDEAPSAEIKTENSDRAESREDKEA